MKIKLTRDLWNHKSNEIIEAGKDRGTWAVNKGYASEVPAPSPSPSPSPAQNKAIEPKYKRNKIK